MDRRAKADAEGRFSLIRVSGIPFAVVQERLLQGQRDAGCLLRMAEAGTTNRGDNMGSDCEPDETEGIWSVDSRSEMEYRLHSLRSLVCELLKTNQELRDALFDAQGNAEPQSRNTPK